VLKSYLAAYTKALKDKPTATQPFRKAYIDAFAGTGSRAARERGTTTVPGDLLFPDLNEPAPQKLLDGSAKLALQVEPRFDKYIFIERSSERCHQLETLKQEFSDLAADIDVRQGDANEVIQGLCGRGPMRGSPIERSCFSIPTGCRSIGRPSRRLPRRRRSICGCWFRWAWG
jgi:three-Cys-motif partner protein